MQEQLKDIFLRVTDNETKNIESFFNQPGGRKYLENIMLILINTLPHPYHERKRLYLDYVGVLNQIEQRIRQKKGQDMLEDIFRSDGKKESY